MTKKYTFLDDPQWAEIVQTIKGIYTSDGTMATILDWERVLDESDIYAFKNWKLGELVDGPVINKYSVTCTFMWPRKLMPDPRGAKRLIPLGCKTKFKKTTIKVPIKIEAPDDYSSGTHYPRLIDRQVWLVNITIPKKLMNDIREGSIDIAEQNIDLEDLDEAYAKDYDKADVKDQDAGQAPANGGMGGMGEPGGGLPQLPPA
jgi:hypothetical protein